MKLLLALALLGAVGHLRGYMAVLKRRLSLAAKILIASYVGITIWRLANLGEGDQVGSAVTGLLVFGAAWLVGWGVLWLVAARRAGPRGRGPDSI